MFEVLIDLEVSLVKAFGWSLRDIDDTDVDSMIGFLARFTRQGDMKTKVFCDEVPWL